MEKRVFIVHGWDGYPEEGWFPWLKRELEAKGFTVLVPQLPEPSQPRIHTWVPALAQTVGTADTECYFVGHSMGCQTIARYLATLPAGMQVGGAVFVAGFFKHLSGLENDPEVVATDKHWLETPIDLDNVKSHLINSVAIFSDNDPFVPLDNQADFTQRLGSTVITERGMGHFSGSDGVTKLPVALQSILDISKTV